MIACAMMQTRYSLPNLSHDAQTVTRQAAKSAGAFVEIVVLVILGMMLFNDAIEVDCVRAEQMVTAKACKRVENVWTEFKQHYGFCLLALLVVIAARFVGGQFIQFLPSN